MAKRKARQEAPSEGPSAAEAVKRRRRAAQKGEIGSDVQPAFPDVAPIIQKRGRGRQPSCKALKKREAEAQKAAEAAAASEPAERGPIVHSGPSLEDQIKRLQEDDAGEGSGLTRRRSCSMHALYNMAETNPKPGRGSRLREASTAKPEGIKVTVEEKPILANGKGGASNAETPTEGEHVEGAAAGVSPPKLPCALAAEERPAHAAAEPTAEKLESSAPPAPQAAHEELSQKNRPQEEQAAGDSKPPPAKKADSAPLQTASVPDAEDFSMQDSQPAGHAAPSRPASAPEKRVFPKGSPEDKSLGRQASLMKNVPVKTASPKSRPEEKPQGDQTSEKLPVKRASPKSGSEYIPLGKAAKLRAKAIPRSILDRRDPTSSAQEALPVDRASAAAAAAGKAPSKRPAGQPTTLQLDQVSRQGLRRPGARRSPPSPPHQQQEPSQPAAAPLGDSDTRQEAPRSLLHSASSAAGQVQVPSPTPVASAAAETQGAEQALLAGEQAAAAGAASAAVAVPLPERRLKTMGSLLEERQKGSTPRVTAITAPRPTLAAEPHLLSRPGNSSQESALTSSQSPASSKPWDSPSQEQKQAEEKQRQAEQRKAKEEQLRAKEQQRILQEVEMGLDRGSTSVQGIREMTALVLSPGAQGLEPRIVRGIIERLQQQAVDVAHAEFSPAASKKKVALLYVLDSVLKAAKAREEKLGPRDPAMVKSFQRFANAAAVGMPCLVAATLGDPHYFEKALKRIADAEVDGELYLGAAAPHEDPLFYEKMLKVFKVWDERSVLSKKVLQPHLEELRKVTVSDAQAGEPAQPEEDFGLQLAGDADTENEDGWEDDGAAPTLNDLPKLPQVVEALKAPWERSGGTDRAVGVAADSPEGSPWHQGPSPKFDLPGEACPVVPPGQVPGSVSPDFEEKAAKAPWHQLPEPAARRLHTGALQQQVPRPLYPHQIGHYLPQLPQPPAYAVLPATAAAPYALPNSAARAYAMPSTAAAAQATPITLRPPGHVPLPGPLPAPGRSFGQPVPRPPVSMPQQPLLQDLGRQSSMVAPTDAGDPGFLPPLPPDEPPPLPDEAPPPLPDEAPPPLPARDDLYTDAPPPFFRYQQHQQQPVHAYGPGIPEGR